jgi:hypothetical protein
MMLLLFKMRRGKWLINLGDSEALLKADLKPLNREEVESLTKIGYTKESFIRLYLSATGLIGVKPGQSTPRQVKHIAEHIAGVDLFYLERLRARNFDEWPLNFLEFTSELVSIRLSNFQTKEVQYVVGYHPPDGWTEMTELEGGRPGRYLGDSYDTKGSIQQPSLKIIQLFSEKSSK